MSCLLPVLLAAVSLLATGAPAQCTDPTPGRDGFPVKLIPRLDVTYSDGYRTQATAAHPTARPGPCGWPLLILVPGLGQTRTELQDEAMGHARRGYFVATYDVRGQASARDLNPKRGSMLWALDEWIDLAEMIEFVAAAFRGTADASRIGVAGDSQGAVHAWAAAAYSGRALPPNARRTRRFPRISCVVPRVFAPQTVEVLVPDESAFYYRLSEFAFEAKVPSVELDASFRKRLASYLEANDPPGLARYLRGIPGKDFTKDLVSTQVPVLHIVSWLDLFMAPNLSFEAFRLLPQSTPKRIHVATGFHGTPLNTYQILLRQEITFSWLDRFLKQLGERVELGPPVSSALIPSDPRLYNHTLSLWRHRADLTFPPQRSTDKRLYLRAAGRLLESKPTGVEGPGVIRHTLPVGYGVRDFQKDTDPWGRIVPKFSFSSLIFRSEPVPAEVELAGSPAVTLDVRPTRPEVQIGLRLFAITPEGRVQQLSSGGVGLRGADTTRSQPVRIVMGATGCLLPKGTRLAIEIANQAIQTPATTDAYRLIPMFHDFQLSIGYQPGRLSFVDLPLRTEVQPDLSTADTVILMDKPGAQTLFLRSAANRRNLPYLILASLSGEAPVPLGTSTLWLERDALTDVFLGLAGSPLLAGFVGLLNDDGAAIGTLSLGALGTLPPSLYERNLHLAPVVFAPPQIWAGAPVQLRFR